MQAFAANLRRLLGAMVRQGRDLRLQQTASSLTLLTLLAIVPMAALGLLVLTALPAFESMRGDLQRYLETHLFLPSFSDAVVRNINRFVGAADRLSTIGTAAFLATGLGAMLTVDRTLNGIWQTLRPRPLWQRLMLYWTLLTLGPILLAAAITLQLKVQSHLQGVAPLTKLLSAVLPTALGVSKMSQSVFQAWNSCLAVAANCCAARYRARLICRPSSSRLSN
jgi:membrane protein